MNTLLSLLTYYHIFLQKMVNILTVDNLQKLKLFLIVQIIKCVYTAMLQNNIFIHITKRILYMCLL